MELIKRLWTSKIIRYGFPVFLGGTLGYLYYAFIGCNGSCAIAGNPWISTAYGAVLGAFFINKNIKENND